MNPHRVRLFFLLTAACVAVFPPAHTATLDRAAGPLRLALDPDAAWVKISFRDRPLLEYAFAANQFKPYVRALYSLTGENVLLDSPPDHVHHHGLMYAIRVNGINFWEEQTDPGVEKPLGSPLPQLSDRSGGLPTAVLTQTIHWVASAQRALADTAPVALLVERRQLTLTVDEKRGEVALQWEGDFEAGPGAEQVTLGGALYHGLGLRFVHPFDHSAKRMNSAGLAYLPAGGNEVTPAQWTAMSQNVNGRDLTVAMFNHPANPGPSVFFSMLNAFAYVSATQALDQKPLVYRRGERFRLRYLVLVNPSALTSDALQKRNEAWVKAGH